MALSIKRTPIEGLTLIYPYVFEDERGYFIKDFEAQFYNENNLPTEFLEFNESKSKKGTIRGLHFQQKFSQGKLIRVVKGAVYDVAVDLRLGSPTFGKWMGFELSEYNHDVLYIPEGFAHGFLALEEDSIFSYKCTNKYAPEFDSGVRYNDPDINVEWPVHRVGGWENVITSEKDGKLQSLQEFVNKGEAIE
ncbi:dTDP-4-dehydrorhamnose 3,5-epimerase [Bacteroides thetaiotaomicron]|uniref:dTDP-4-dehydrorhamnose 3,5-epimerase n=1 Tax=Bacteroides thetaiotaomicron TaxID=818 RepID=UPI00089F977A|nr:dTDP-4-dehydrorhamnose 3,5-epimerase [Bacteroides thetaiotaomicron]MBS5446930.1 dTDP-4-dehydrorhamnose 3,5-epimerase [Bacteroides thetaiotaomicron]SEF81703.1 dTDP-4-dehydrorhamnose 3,5-epimerase [Bacteroides thetaiotaomicron]